MFSVGYPIGALSVLLYYIVSYFVFIKKQNKRNTEAYATEVAALARLRKNGHIPKLYRNQLASTPMLIGIVWPKIILPDREYTDAQLQAVLIHELTHLRRKDVFIKWVSLLACAAHWFNPVVWFVRREIDHACELSCDEAVIKNLDANGKQKYGDTLLYIATESKTPRAVLSITMCEEKKALMERLGAIMASKKYTRLALLGSTILIISAILAACVLGSGQQTQNEPIEFEVVYSDVTDYSYSLQLKRGNTLYSDYTVGGIVQMAGDLKGLKEIGFAVGEKDDEYRIFERNGYSIEEFIIVQDNGFMNPATIYIADPSANVGYNFDVFVVSGYKLFGYMDDEALSALTPAEPLNSAGGYTHNYEEIRFDLDRDGCMNRFQLSVYDSGIYDLYFQYARPRADGNGLAFIAADDAILWQIEQVEELVGAGEKGWYDQNQRLRYERYSAVNGGGEVTFVYTDGEDNGILHRLVWVIAEGKQSPSTQSVNTAPEKAPRLEVLMTASGATKLIQAAQLTTSWSFVDENGDGTGYEADSAHPLQLNDYSSITLSTGGVSAEIELLFSDNFPPHSISVQRWDAKHTSNEATDMWNQGEKIKTNGYRFSVEPLENDFIYEVYAQWEQGSSYYVFRVHLVE